MYRLRALLLLMVIALLSTSVMGSIIAQDATTTPEGSGQTAGTLNTCDSSTILLFGLAQRYFGYTPSTASTLDASTYEFGQYSPLFDMSTMPTAGSTDMSATEDPMAQATEDMSATADTSGMGMSSVFLNPPIVTDENPSCSLLRADLEAFFAGNLMSPDWDNRFRSGMGGMGSSTNSNG